MSMLADEFRENGFVVIRGFYDIERDLRPVWEDIRAIVSLVADKYDVAAPASDPFEAMTRGYGVLRDSDRRWAGEVYDAVKQSPAFCALVAKRENAELFRQLRSGAVAGLAAGGSGIRIDNPADERFRTYWHQEFPAQFRSLDGIVFWSPLLPVRPQMGPVEVCIGSHKGGLIPVIEDDGGTGKAGAYALRLADETAQLSRYGKAAPLTDPGDLILMDFLTLHQSGRNISNSPRWSMQFRYFNFADPVGRKIAWAGSFAAGIDYRSVLESLGT